MNTTTRTRRLEVEAARHRAVENLRPTAPPASPARRFAILSIAAALFAITFAARLAISDPGALVANFYVIPIALVATEFGTRAGLLAGVLALVLVVAWSAIETVHVNALGYSSRGAALLVSGALIGRFSERLRHDIAERQRAQRRLSLYADQLERANEDLARSVERLEAFAEIARSVGGETDLERVLTLILAHGREIVPADRLLLYLPAGDELAAAGAGEPGVGPTGAGAAPRLALHGSLAGEVLLSRRSRRIDAGDGELLRLSPDASAAILVPLVFRGEPLGVLAAIQGPAGRRFEEDDEQLLMSVAASAATAVATARSVAAARLRLSLEAADQARARWARELHDETLQGLTGVRMVLSASLARDDPAAIRTAATTADHHLAEEMRKLRDLIAELRPAALDDLGLGAAIESLAKRQAQIAGLAVEVQIALDGGVRLAPDAETAIYRIAQEALSNAVKHSGARRVVVRVEERAETVTLTVSDDGQGFDPDAAHHGFGLTGMQERAVLAGGRLSLSSQDGGPTCVTAVLPAPAATRSESSKATAGSRPSTS